MLTSFSAPSSSALLFSRRSAMSLKQVTHWLPLKSAMLACKRRREKMIQ